MVSVIIPTYKRSNFLRLAIKSVLNQSYKNVEIIVVDDNGIGSLQEETKIIVSDFSNIKLVTYASNMGACFARNQGAKSANGDFLMFLDDDDYYFKDKVSKQISFMLKNNLEVCLCAMKRLDALGNEIISTENYPRGTNLKSFILEGNSFTSMLAIKRDLFLKLEGFTPISRFQDKLFLMKLLENNVKVGLLNEQLLVLNEHEEDRISTGSIINVSDAIRQIYKYEKKFSYLFSKKEKKFLKNRYYFKLASTSINGTFLQKMNGVSFLFLSGMKNFNSKLLLKLILPEFFINFIKR
jgi:glycosyltransferase involved in cell wall biosynthesis